MSTTDPSSAPVLVERTISRTEALAAGVSIIPPNPPNAPLVTTISNTPVERSASPTRQLSRTISPSQAITSPPKAPNDLAPIRSSSPSPPPESQPQHPPLKGARLFLTATLVTFTMMLGAGSAQGLNIALPTIGKELDMKTSDLQWIASAYTLTNGCFLLLSGRMADVHGRKLLFLCGMAWWSIWCLVGSFMNNGPALVVARALAGSGAAMSAIGVIATHFSGKARSTAFAAFAAGAPIGAAFGLIIGGLPTAYSKYTWRPCLWILAGLGFAVVIVAYFVIPSDPYHTSDRRVDWLGAALITVGLIFIQFAISAGETAPQGWATSYIITLLVLGILLVIAFFAWEHYVVYKTTRPPLMRLQLWTRAKGRLASVYFIGFVSWMGFTALFYHSTLFYQDIQMTGPVGALLRFIPCSVSGVLCNVLVAFLVAKVPTQAIIVTGILATGIASVLMAVAPADVSYWRLPFNSMWLSVMGADFLMATGSIFVAALALPDEQSVAGALFQTLVQLGGAFGLAITTVISDAYDKKSLAEGVDPLNSQLNGIHAAFWLGSGTSFLACAVAIIMLRGMGAIGKQPKKPAEPVEVPDGDEDQKSVTGVNARSAEEKV